MKRVKKLAEENSKPIWQHFTANKPVKTKVSRKITRRKHTQTKKMSDNPLTNVYTRLQKKRSSSRVLPVLKSKQQMNNLISTMYKKLGKKRSTSRKAILEVQMQKIDDQFGDEPM
jgi:(p)ppGpp synthase/HD superfamily hydrolase